MIWYILYPFRGTTEPPKLSPAHPIRRTFQRHGTATAQHWLLSLLLSVVVAILFCYPVLFLDDSPTATGLHNLPNHAWTSTAEFEGDRSVDVEMRQVWVHGDYMKALDARVLREALRVQTILIADGIDGYTESHPHDLVTQPLDVQESMEPLRDPCIPRSPRNRSWGFHSPLMYWNCSPAVLDADRDVLATINSKSEQQSFLNFTLRPSSVFAGKSFENHKLQAADALVITLFDRTASSLATVWEERSTILVKDLSDQWSLYPEDGKVIRSRLYEFRFKPMTFNDNLVLAMVYIGMIVYVIIRFRNFRAVKSRLGLGFAILFKISVSIFASFTICDMLRISLAHVPHEVYPFVVLVFGLENIFRLINEILANPPEMPTVQRIGNALGEVGHLTLARAGQNLFILYLSSRLVVPEMAAFCAFAAVALVFDYIFHLTFFLAVLSVDVRRMELQESLERINHTQLFIKSGRQERRSWLEAFRQGRLPFSTRVAGSAAIISFLLALNWHFFDHDSRTFSLRRILDFAMAKQTKSSPELVRIPPPIYQARTPADWLRIQDHHTAKELIQFIKPNAYSFIARVYDPLIIVLKGAEGRAATQQPESLLSAVRQLAYQHFFPAALIVVFSIGFVTLLMNYLLWNESPVNTENGIDEEPLISVKNLPTSHSLDVIRLTSCGKGHLMSISVDRSASVWFQDQVRGYCHTSLKPASMSPILWPILASTMDETGHWLAICTDEGRLAIWSLPQRRFLSFSRIDLKGQTPTVFSFASFHTREHDRLGLLIITPNGLLTDIKIPSGELRTQQISENAIVSACLITCAKGETSIIFASRNSQLHIATTTERGQWNSEIIVGIDGGSSKLRSVSAASSLGLIFAIRVNEVEVIDFRDRSIIRTIQTNHIKSQSLRILHSARRYCSCGANAIHSLSIAYTEAETQHMLMQTFVIDETSTSLICLHPSSENETHICLGLDRATQTVHTVDHVGVWEATNVQSVIGIRKCPSVLTPPSSITGCNASYFSSSPGTALKFRARDCKSPSTLTTLESAMTRNFTDPALEPELWEAWTLTYSGEFYSVPLDPIRKDDFEIQRLGLDEQLFVATPGPITRLGKCGVAVGFGNAIKLITLAKDRFEAGTEECQDPAPATYKWRTRKGTGRKTQ